VPLLFYGPGIKAGGRDEPVTPQAAAAVLARSLRIDTPHGAYAGVPDGLLDEPGRRDGARPVRPGRNALAGGTFAPEPGEISGVNLSKSHFFFLDLLVNLGMLVSSHLIPFVTSVTHPRMLISLVTRLGDSRRWHPADLPVDEKFISVCG
jgi:hypothetical protein